MSSFGRQLITFTYYYSIMMPSTNEINRYKVNQKSQPRNRVWTPGGAETL